MGGFRNKRLKLQSDALVFRKLFKFDCHGIADVRLSMDDPLSQYIQEDDYFIRPNGPVLWLAMCVWGFYHRWNCKN